jgi:hypothetical protein
MPLAVGKGYVKKFKMMLKIFTGIQEGSDCSSFFMGNPSGCTWCCMQALSLFLRAFIHVVQAYDTSL